MLSPRENWARTSYQSASRQFCPICIVDAFMFSYSRQIVVVSFESEAWIRYHKKSYCIRRYFILIFCATQGQLNVSFLLFWNR